MKLKSFAKINLFLEVIGKYENNFHIINSIVSRINIYDEISIKKSKELTVSFKGQFGSLVDSLILGSGPARREPLNGPASIIPTSSLIVLTYYVPSLKFP